MARIHLATYFMLIGIDDRNALETVLRFDDSARAANDCHFSGRSIRARDHKVESGAHSALQHHAW
jgi:hypothetical protein